jgi:quercetin dioxygenase-like cupin family protein
MPHVVKAEDRSRTGANPEADGVSARWMISSDLGGARHGIVGELELAPGAAEPLHRHSGADEAAFVLSGSAIAVGADGEYPAPAGALILASRHVWHAIRAGDEPVRVLLIYGGESDLTALDVELAGDDASGEPPRVIDSSALTPRLNHNPEMGFFNMAASFLVSEDGLSDAELVVGAAQYGTPDPVGGHALHRHPVAEEFLYIRDGRASHLMEEGTLPMEPGDIAFIPAGEWHGIWHEAPAATQSVFGYLGLTSLAAGGYELPENAAAPD